MGNRPSPRYSITPPLHHSTIPPVPGPVALARHAMATRFEIVLHGDNPAALRAAGEAALDEIDRLEAQLSLYRPSSEIAHLNRRAAQGPVRVTPSLFALLEHARKLHVESGGAFDITIAPLVRCWGFMGGSGVTFQVVGQASRPALRERLALGANSAGETPGAAGGTPTPLPEQSRSGRLPDPAELAEARAKVGMELVRLDAENFTVQFAREGVMLDLGAIGKGYAIERAAEVLREAGVTSALLHGGTSTVYGLGQPPGAKVWKVAVAPKEGADKLNRLKGLNELNTCVVPLRDEALSVSAVWGKFFQTEGRTFGHVLDPRTGQPVAGAVLAAVVLPSATETDALSTALLVRGTEGHEAIAKLRPDLRTVLVTEAEGRLRLDSHGIESEK